jgi:hypothetical protein
MAFPQLPSSQIGQDRVVNAMANGNLATTFAMASLNSGWCAVHKARTTDDVISVYVNFSAITAAGTIQARIETIDESTMKPTSTLYDANAVKSFTPTTGWNTITFDTPPSTGRTVGNFYGLVLLTTTGGTTMTLRSVWSQGVAPTLALTAADGTTRANFAIVATAAPIAVLGLEGGFEDSEGMVPFAAATTAFQVYGTRAQGVKLTINSPIIFNYYELAVMSVTGTPTGVQFKTFDGSSAVSGTNVSLPAAAAWTGAASRPIRCYLPAPVTLAAGTYRIVTYQSDTSTASGNRFNMFGAAARSNATVPDDFITTNTTDVTAGTITWTDDDTAVPLIGIGLDDTAVASGSGNASSIFGGVVR